ncbi:MAG: DUF1285 domain-containing protein [Rhodobacteraceae bacterium]|nr:DUF1285 domain-containing protein [Paracoccaceae bacterium]
MATQNIVKPSPDSLAGAARGTARRGPPPLHLWNPPDCGEIDIRIARDGTWFYLGTPIGRAPLVRLFASILRREGDRYVLVTPVEKVGIRVEDVPFVAVDVEGEAGEAGAGPALAFTTNVGDRVTAGADRPIRVVRDPATGEPAPYVLVRPGLEARIDRKTFYRLVALGEHADTGEGRWFGLRSAGVFFPVIPSAELPEERAP